MSAALLQAERRCPSSRRRSQQGCSPGRLPRTNSLVRVDRLVRLLPVEEVIQKMDAQKNPRRTTRGTTSRIAPLSSVARKKTCSTGVVILNRSKHSPSNFARESDVYKSCCRTAGRPQSTCSRLTTGSASTLVVVRRIQSRQASAR